MRRGWGFTLIEVAAVLGIVALLAAVGLVAFSPVLKKQREGLAIRSIPGLIRTAATLARAKRVSTEVRREGNRVYIAVCPSDTTCYDAGSGGSYEIVMPSTLDATDEGLWVQFNAQGMRTRTAPELYAGHTRYLVDPFGAVSLEARR